MTDVTAPGTVTGPLNSPDYAKRLAARHRAETRFRAYGLGAILIGMGFLVALLWTIVSEGAPAFLQAEIRVDVTFDKGCSIDKRLPALRGAFTITYEGPDGVTAHQPIDRLQLLWMDDPAPGISRSHFGATVTGSFVPDTTGEWTFGLTSVGAAVVRVDGEVVVDLSTPLTGARTSGWAAPRSAARQPSWQARPSRSASTTRCRSMRCCAV